MIQDYRKVFEYIVSETEQYVQKHNLKAMILGISGGIDSTVCAAICHEVSKRTGVPLIGRSLPTKNNKDDEVSTADLVGQVFCDDYQKVSLHPTYSQVLTYIGVSEDSLREDSECPQTPVANGNIQARLRMIYLYNLASIHKGFVIDTDNRTENALGYWTLHGDVGDFKPIGDLWKTEIFKLAEWLVAEYNINHENFKCAAMQESLKLKPTAGLGITSNDLEEIGAESYDQVDGILQELEAWQTLNFKRRLVYNSVEFEKESFLDEQQMLCYPIEVITAVIDKYYKSSFKRRLVPTVYINKQLV